VGLKGDIAMALMRRQSLVKFDAPLCETIVDTPKPQGREVLVRIERCGLCHSDLHIPLDRLRPVPRLRQWR
jgi:D-arabinose 1-dehydrogenase-like Zn-dependent alcohol dehydrogenase